MKKKWLLHSIAVGALVVFTVSGLASASQPEDRAVVANVHDKRYSDLQEFIETAEKQLEGTYDYVEKSEICQGVIEEIYNFLYESDDEEINNSVSEILDAWRDRRFYFDQTWEELTDGLVEALRKKADEVSKARNSGYNVEDMQIIDRDLIRDDYSARMSLTFHVKMRGNILGLNRREFDITVEGTIDMRYDYTEVLDRVYIR